MKNIDKNELFKVIMAATVTLDVSDDNTTDSCSEVIETKVEVTEDLANHVLKNTPETPNDLINELIEVMSNNTGYCIESIDIDTKKLHEIFQLN